MENAHVSLEASTGSEATLNEQGMLMILAHEVESGNILRQVTLDAQQTWTLLQWLYSHSDMLYGLTHPDQDITTKLRTVDRQGKPRRDIEADDAETQARQDWANDE